MRLPGNRSWRGTVLAIAVYAGAPPICTQAQTAVRGLSPPGAVDTAPVWAPDGRRLACLTQTPHGKRVSVMAPDGSGRTTFAAPAADAVAAVWNPSGEHLVVQATNAGTATLWLLLPEVRRLATGRDPAFSPDGRWLAFATDTAVCVMAGVGGTPRRLTTGTAHTGFGHPAWTTDSRELIYASDGSLWRVPVTGAATPRPFLTKVHYPYRQALPAPGGHRVLVVGDSSVATGEQAGDPLWLADPDGGGAIRLPAAYSPAWLPDASAIVGSRGQELFLLDHAGALTPLFPGREPSVAPDGRQIAFSRLRSAGDGDDLFGGVRRPGVFAAALPAARAAAPPGASIAIPRRWSLRLRATTDTGLHDRVNPVARVVLDVPAALAAAGLDAVPAPASLRVYEQRDATLIEVPSAVYPDPEASGLCELAWRLPGKRDMLSESIFLLCFAPSEGLPEWTRPPAWPDLVPSSAWENLVPNPSLERADAEGRVDGWQAVAPAGSAQAKAEIATGVAFHGSRCLYLESTDPALTPDWRSPRFPLEAGREYLAEFAVRAVVRAGYGPVVWLYYLDARGRPITDDITVFRTAITAPPHNGKWQEASQKIEPPPGTLSGQFRVPLYRTLGRAWLDRFRVTPFVPRDEVRVLVGPAR